MRALLIALLMGAAAATAAPAQEFREHVEAPAAVDIDPLLRRVASLWAGGDAAAIARHVADAGVELEVEGRPLGPIAARQLAAALRRVFSGQETVSVVTTLSSRVHGADDRAFGELAWERRPDGAAFTERSTVFVGLVREGLGWRISQIRILP